MLSLHRYTIPTLRFRNTAPTTFIDSFISTSHDAKEYRKIPKISPSMYKPLQI